MPASTPVSLQPSFAYAAGDTIAGKYALEQLLGSGGMGAVFRARNVVIDMPVAIKLIRADLDRELFSARLLQEARAAAKLAHPAIVRVFDVGRTALGDPFIVMELLDGESLSALIEREGRLSSARAVQLLLPIIDALSFAHAKGFVHRDVKPDNVLLYLDEGGLLQPKLVDFGIVKHEQLDDGQGGSVFGSPDYMSPEQARGLPSVDLRSDIWSVAVVLYEAISGETPFKADSYATLLRQIVDTSQASLRDRSAADDALSAIVEKCLRKRPEERFVSMGQLGKALAAWLYDQGIGEDACGVSLEAKWLSRASDPSVLPRVSRSSHPDSWPEPPSGVRAVSREHLGNAATLPSAGTPLSLAKTSASGPPHVVGRKRPLVLGLLALALLLLATWLVARVLRRAAAPAPLVSAEQPPALLVVEESVSLAPTPAASASDALPDLAATREEQSSARRHPAAPPPGSSRPAASSDKPGKASDLLAPY